MGYLSWKERDLEGDEFEVWRRRQTIMAESKFEETERDRHRAYRDYIEAHRRVLEKPSSLRRLAKFTRAEEKFLAASEAERAALREFQEARAAASREAFEDSRATKEKMKARREKK